MHEQQMIIYSSNEKQSRDIRGRKGHDLEADLEQQEKSLKHRRKNDAKLTLRHTGKQDAHAEGVRHDARACTPCTTRSKKKARKKPSEKMTMSRSCSRLG
jgi:hypothetical protein